MRVCVLGLGAMGLPMAMRLADRFELRAYDVDDTRLRTAKSAGIEIATVTLHVGIGTFKPVSVDRIEEHRMERERYEISREAAEAIGRARERAQRGEGRVVAVGTTVVRTLEGAALAHADRADRADRADQIPPHAGSTEIFLTPGCRFQVVDALLTNFHLPRSTLLMLVSAFAGKERVLAAYREVIEVGYRFYSYGDAMFLEKEVLGPAAFR
jgi:S-adenosylmethionine:tRNA ribosyltransferase-isomerase